MDFLDGFEPADLKIGILLAGFLVAVIAMGGPRFLGRRFRNRKERVLLDPDGAIDWPMLAVVSTVLIGVVALGVIVFWER